MNTVFKPNELIICITNKDNDISLYDYPNIGQLYRVEDLSDSSEWIYTKENAFLIYDFISLPDTKLTRLLFL
jgi:hypothetical protein